MKKKWMIVICTLLFIFLVGSSTLTAQENLSLSISQMVALAISNNLNFKKASYQLKNIQLDAQQLEAENLMDQSNMTHLQKEISLLQQQEDFQKQKDQLIIQVVDNYFQLLLSEKDIERKEKNAQLERIVLDEVEAQVAAGYSIDLELLQQGNIYYDALFAFERAKLNHQQLIIEIKNILGITDKAELQSAPLNIPDFPEINLSESLQNAQSNSLSLKSKELEVQLNNARLGKAKVSQLPELEITRLENILGISQLEKSLLEQDINYQVLTHWQNFSQSRNDILLSQQSLRQMKENQSIIERQINAGLRNDDDSLSAAIGVLDSEYRLVSSVRNYLQSYLELQRMRGMMDEEEIKG